MSVRIDVDRGLEIRKEIEHLEAELGLIEDHLRAAALAGDQVDLKDTDREGKQFLAHGTDQIVPVVLTADVIIGSFKKDSPTHSNIRLMARDHLGDFYKPVVTYENLCKSGKQFRAKSDEILGSFAPPFITACLAKDRHGIPKSDIKVCWKEAVEVK